MHLFLLLVFLLFVNFTLLVPGYAIVRKINIFMGKPGIELCTGYMLSIAVFATVALLGYIFNISQLMLRIILYAFLLGGTILLVTQKYYRDTLVFRFPLLCLLLMSAFSIFFTQLSLEQPYKIIPDPQPVPGNSYSVFDVKILNLAQTNANDNSIPYRQAQFINNRSDPAKDSFIDEWGVTFFQRTPLMGAVTGSYFSILNEKLPIGYIWNSDSHDTQHTYLQFQIIASLLNSLFILPAYFLLSKLFSRKTSTVALLFMVPSQYFLFNSFFSWPKSLVAFFVLFSWWLILEKRFRYLLLAGVASGLAYLTHDLALLYLGASILMLLWLRRFRDTLIFTAISVVFMIPWLITSSVIYKKPSTFFYYPLSTTGIPQYSDRHRLLHDFLNTSPLKLIGIRLYSLTYLLTPFQLFTSEGGQQLTRRLWAIGIFTVPGATGLGIYIASIVALAKQRRLLLWILAGIPILACVVVIGWPKGLGALHFAEVVVSLLTGLGVWLLLTLKSKLWLLGGFAINIVQTIYFVLFSFGFKWKVWFGSVRDIVILACLFMVIAVCGYLIYIIANNKKSSLLSRMRLIDLNS